MCIFRFFAVLAALTLSYPCFAQERSLPLQLLEEAKARGRTQPAERPVQLPLEHQKQLADILGVSPSDREFQALIQGRGHLGKAAPSGEEGPEEVIAHIKGKSGRKMPQKPDPEKLLNAVGYDEAEARRAAKRMVDGQLEQAKKNLRLPPLPSCRASNTIVLEREEIAKGNENKIFGDFLFIRPEKKTTSPEDIYGYSALISVYDPKRPDPLSLSAKLLGVTCLPFRIRTTGRFIFQHEGEAALYNYDDDPNGKGEKLF